MDLETEVYSGNSQKAVQRYTTVWKEISLFVLLATTIKITTFCPNMTKITAADYMVSGCSISIQFLNLRTLKKPIANKTTLINSIAVITIKWTFPVTHCVQL